MSKGKHWKREKNRCALCGQYVSSGNKKNGVIGATGKVVCSTCLHTSNRIINVYKQIPDRLETPVDDVMTPSEIIKGLDRSIIGQEEAKKAIAVALWKQLLRTKRGMDIPKLNLLVYGPTGCGKTAIVQMAAELVGLPFISFDASTLTQAGYRGRDACDVIKDLVSRYKGKGDIEKAVVFLDEIDKLAANGNSARNEYSRADQHSLLKLVEDTSYEIDGKWISTKDMLFIFGGAFSGLSARRANERSMKPIGFLPVQENDLGPERTDLAVEEFIQYGMEPELMGRIGQIVPVHALTVQDLARILLESNRSAYLEYRRFFFHAGVELTLSQAEAEQLAEEALERGTGARGLNALIEKRVEPLLLLFSEGKLQGQVSVMEGGADCERVS